VCPTEIIAFSERIQEFKDIDVEVGGAGGGRDTGAAANPLPAQAAAAPRHLALVCVRRR
jgi:hypothetical protein